MGKSLKYTVSSNLTSSASLQMQEEAFSSTIAAVKAGLGITVLPAHMLSSGIHPIRSEVKLPELADAEIALMKRDDLSKASEMLAEHIVHSLEYVSA